MWSGGRCRRRKATTSRIQIDDPNAVRKIVIDAFDGKHVTGHFEVRGNAGAYAMGSFDGDLCTLPEPDDNAPVVCK